ncbi:MAG: hypothetical protein GX457_17400 [Thermotogaceae bacterium]|jgi:type I restriction enzyme S subunit|nr:hypothetical protein [Thermotogaceae bacterium]
MNRTVTQHKRAAYPAYKPSGIEWLGEIPEHWEVYRLKTITRLGYGDSLSADDRIPGSYPVYGSNGVVGEHVQANTKAPCLIVGRKGSFGKVSYSNIPCFAIDTTYFIDDRFTSNDLRWLYYSLQWLRLDSFSKDSAVPGLSREDAYNNVLPFCQIDEQRSIAAFLDRETARIDALIEKKRRQIELLKEKRSALISHAVTKGLDPNAKMKDSGIEWLGEIPEGWEVLPFKRLGDFQGGAGFPNDEQGCEENELPFYKVSDTNLHGNEIFMTVHNNAVSRETAQKLHAYIFPRDTIVFAKVGAALLLNKRRILTQPACIDNNMMGFIRRTCELMWAYFLMCSLDLSELANPGAVPSISEGQIRQLMLPVPPLPEQRAIAAFLDRETARIDALIEKVEKSIELLREYRTALISAAVTGKIDVRKDIQHG